MLKNKAIKLFLMLGVILFSLVGVVGCTNPNGSDNVNATYVCQYDCNTGMFIKDWNTASEACRQLGYNPSNCKHITECCRGERRTALGFIWKFEKFTLSLQYN